MPCPVLMECNRPTTHSYFQRLCNCKPDTKTYTECFWFCTRYDLTKTPMEWLQLAAMEKGLDEPFIYQATRR